MAVGWSENAVLLFDDAQKLMLCPRCKLPITNKQAIVCPRCCHLLIINCRSCAICRRCAHRQRG